MGGQRWKERGKGTLSCRSRPLPQSYPDPARINNVVHALITTRFSSNNLMALAVGPDHWRWVDVCLSCNSLAVGRNLRPGSRLWATTWPWVSVLVLLTGALLEVVNGCRVQQALSQRHRIALTQRDTAAKVRASLQQLHDVGQTLLT